MPQYRIFCSKSEAQNLPSGATITQTYPAFVIVSSSVEVMTEIQTKYPVEELKLPKDPPDVPNVAGLPALFASSPKRGPYFYVVRFYLPVRQAWLDEIEAIGNKVCDVIGRFTLVVRCPDKRCLAKLYQLPTQPRITLFIPHLHISPEFWENSNGKSSLINCQFIPDILTASFFTQRERQRAKRNLQQRGLKNLTISGRADLMIDLIGRSDKAEALRLIAGQRGLRSLEEQALIQPNNNKARFIIGDGVVTSPKLERLGLTGEGEIVAVADSGLDTGDLTTIHPDFRGRVKSLRKMPIAPFWQARIESADDKEVSDRNEGHGTHLCGSILGNGTYARVLGLNPLEGVAPEAKLVFQALEYKVDKWNKLGEDWWHNVKGEPPPKYYFLGLKDNLTELLQAAYDEGARIFLIAWSGGTPGAYDPYSRQLDQFVRNREDMLVVVAAGNDGQPIKNLKTNQDVVDLGSIKPPATAKNCLTVGASENDRFKDQAHVYKGGRLSRNSVEIGTVTYGNDPNHTWLSEPFVSDSLVDCINHIYAMSSRGPKSGRRKPDVVAPGTFILSTRSQALDEKEFGKWAIFEKDNRAISQGYMYLSGTSMAAALVAGCAALVRQYLRETGGIPSPSAALLKAFIIHSAQYHHYVYAHPDSHAWSDPEQGWGRVELRSVLKPEYPQRVLFLDKRNGLKESSAPFEFSFNLDNLELSNSIQDVGKPITENCPPDDPRPLLRITLVYTDLPGQQVINNLSLSATAPNGKLFLGNGFLGFNTLDSLDNVEAIIVSQPEAGPWQVKVTASDLPQGGSQGFALVISGPIVKVNLPDGWKSIDSI